MFISFIGGIGSGVFSYISDNKMWGTVFIVVCIVLMAVSVFLLVRFLAIDMIDKRIETAIDAAYQKHDKKLETIKYLFDNDIRVIRQDRDIDIRTYRMEMKEIEQKIIGYSSQKDKGCDTFVKNK